MHNCNCDKINYLSVPYMSARALHKVRDVTMRFWWEFKVQALIVLGHSHHSVHFRINSRNLAQGLPIIHFVIFFGGGQKPSFIRGLICINSKWPLNDLPIITLCPITSEQIKIDTWIIKIIRIEIVMLYNHVFIYYWELICINSRWPPCDLPIITLCIITLKQIKVDTCIMCQNDQDSNYNIVYVYGNRGNGILHQLMMAAIWFANHYIVQWSHYAS